MQTAGGAVHAVRQSRRAASDATADAPYEWLAGRGGRAPGAGSSRRLSRAGRSRGSDAGGAKPPAGRPHGAERRGRGVRPVPRPRSAVPVAGAQLGRGALPPADGGAPGGALLPRAGSCRSRPGRAAPGAAAVTVRRLAEAREPPSCSRVPRAAAAAAGGGGRAAGMTRLLSASVLVALSSTQTDGAASLSSKTQRWPGEWRAQGARGLDPSAGTVPGVLRNWRRAQETFFILRYKRIYWFLKGKR
ncbi:translation initiation factor IF-2-like [Molothrus ater]|uniref:translation initiation factor IF-2-like n=1 Tax=Molothrus ater TaxID=84834 RepID=UPI0023E76961|nr:translation initiation factor IF-2-like [Molothrus ater]